MQNPLSVFCRLNRRKNDAMQHRDLSRQSMAWEPHIHAFASVPDKEQMALPRDGTADQFSMSGIRVGIKDGIDVAGLPTRNGSEAYRDAPPADQDAPVVAALRNAGASIIGKTTTTEFAFTDATNCRNPYDINRTPGGSSSGSGAAEASGMVDQALGTQTAGDLISPA